jgi:DNA-binding response OmpR family regulator
MSLEIIQIIEDDPIQARILDAALRKTSFRTNVAHDGRTGLRDVQRLRPALVLLDVMLPEIDGHEICRLLRSDPQTRQIPIIMITALASEAHRVAGLEMGADDYIVKPFGEQEIIARVRALLRRTRPPVEEDSSLAMADLVLEQDRYDVVFRGQRVTLSGMEWRLLRRLVRSGGEAVPREELCSLLWGEDGLVHEHELDRLIQQLEEKLRDQAVCAGAILGTDRSAYQLSHIRP